jgi:CTP:molybdopterin cytidylyltransferase MocA
VVANPRWADGQATSLQAALGWARAEELDILVVGLGDQPLVPPEAWAAVAAADSPLAIATFGGRRRPPVRLAREVWPLLPTEGDAGARVLMAQLPDLVGEVACPGDPLDVDRPEDLAGPA